MRTIIPFILVLVLVVGLYNYYFVPDVVTFNGEVVPHTFEGGLTHLLSFVEDIAEGFSKMFGNIKTFINTYFNIQEKVSSVLDGFKNVVEPAVAYIKEAIDTVNGWLGDLYDELPNWLKG